MTIEPCTLSPCKMNGSREKYFIKLISSILSSSSLFLHLFLLFVIVVRFSGSPRTMADDDDSRLITTTPSPSSMSITAHLSFLLSSVVCFGLIFGCTYKQQCIHVIQNTYFLSFFILAQWLCYFFPPSKLTQFFLLKIQTEDSWKKKNEIVLGIALLLLPRCLDCLVECTISCVVIIIISVVNICSAAALQLFLNSPKLILIVRESGPVAHPHQQERSEKPRIIKKASTEISK